LRGTGKGEQRGMRLSRDEITALYTAGVEGVIGLIEQLQSAVAA
jgi:hypothetical protein